MVLPPSAGSGTRPQQEIYRNLSSAELTRWALITEPDSRLTNYGALSVRSGKKTGRSPNDKRIVDMPQVHQDVWWGKVNMPLTPAAFASVKARAIDYLNTRKRLFIVDCFAGHDPQYRLKIRIITTRAYHALFMKNMLIEPTPEELHNFGEPDYTIYNAGEHTADKSVKGVTSDTCVALNLVTKEVVILGTQYAGEMKKGVLTIMMYLMAKRGDLCMHASANVGKDGDVSVFFGLSGTGKTTLSADPHRPLVGDDEHVWTEKGVFNIEGGCYAKAVGLSQETEPDIFAAVRFGSVVENAVLKPDGNVDYNDISITENTRVSYPLSYISNSLWKSAVVGHAKNVIFLTNDAYGVLPPVSRLTRPQASFWFIAGYTAKVAGTEVGITEPQPTFSPCFGGPFLVMHPTFYGTQLAEKLEKHNAECWLVNTGWSGGGYGKGKRMKLQITRAILDAIHDGSLVKEQFDVMPGWGLRIPKRCHTIPAESQKVLNPILTWPDKNEYIKTVNHVAFMFRKNFEPYKAKASPEVVAVIPQDYAVAPGSKI